MNNLNSTLIDGTVRSIDVQNVEGFYCATVDVAREYRENGDIKRNSTVVPFRATGRLADTCGKAIRVGHQIRIVGRVSGYDRMHIVAEHVEFQQQR